MIALSAKLFVIGICPSSKNWYKSFSYFKEYSIASFNGKIEVGYASFINIKNSSIIGLTSLFLFLYISSGLRWLSLYVFSKWKAFSSVVITLLANDLELFFSLDEVNISAYFFLTWK